MCVKHDDDDDNDAPTSGMKEERRETQKKNRVCFGPEKRIFTYPNRVAYAPTHDNTQKRIKSQ